MDEVADRVAAEIGGHQADAQAFFRIPGTVAGVRRPLRDAAVPGVPFRVQCLQFRRRDPFSELRANQGVRVRLGEIGLDRDGPPVGGQRLVQSAEVLERVAEIVQGRGVPGISIYRALEDGDGVIQSALVMERLAEIDARRRIVRFYVERPAVGPDGVIEPPLVVEENPEIVMALGEIGVGGDGGLEGGLGLGHVALRLQCCPQVAKDRRVFGRHVPGPAKTGHRFVRPSHRRQRLAQTAEHVRVVGKGFQRTHETIDGLFRLARPQKRVA